MCTSDRKVSSGEKPSAIFTSVLITINKLLAYKKQLQKLILPLSFCLIYIHAIQKLITNNSVFQHTLAFISTN